MYLQTDFAKCPEMRTGTSGNVNDIPERLIYNLYCKQSFIGKRHFIRPVPGNKKVIRKEGKQNGSNRSKI